MSEREFNTEDYEDDMSLASQLGRRRGRRSGGLTEEDTADLTDDDANSGSGDAAQTFQTVQQKGRRKMRITMLGVSGSGKTAFLSGVYQTMMMDTFHGLTLLTSANTDDAFRQIGQIADIALINRDNYEFPLGTQETTIFPMTLQDSGREICDFDFTDYRGGDVLDILNASGDVSASACALKAQLLASDAILIFADAHLLSSGKNVVEWRRATGAAMINPLFNALARNIGKKPLTVLLVLTKIDDENIPHEMRTNHYARLTERAVQAFNLVYETTQDHLEDGWSFGVIPVSAVGEGNSTTILSQIDGQNVWKSVVREGCTPEPYNIEVTMIYTIACILSQWKKADNDEKEALTERLVEAGRGNTFLGNVFSGWKKTQRPEEKVRELLEEIEEKSRSIMELDDHITDLIDKTGALNVVQRRRDRLSEY